MTSTYYPDTTVTIPDLHDYTSIVEADDVVTAYLEIAAVENVLGPNASSLHDPHHQPNTVGEVLDNMDTGKASVDHTHAQFGILTVGGPTNSSNLYLSGTSIQARLNNTVTTLVLNPNGGNIQLGKSGAQVTIPGGLGITGSFSAKAITASSFSGAVAATTLTASSGNITGTLTAVNINASTQIQSPRFLLSNGTTAKFDLNNGETIHGNGTNQTVFDGNGSNSKKIVIGQIRARHNIGFQTANANGSALDWNDAAVVGDESVEASRWCVPLSAYSGWNGGHGVIWFFDAGATNLGWQSYGGAGGYASVTAASFIVGSARATKRNITTYSHGSSRISQLRPVSFTRDFQYHAPSEKVNGYHVPLKGQRRETHISNNPVKHTAGDSERYGTKHIGLIADEVYEAVPEAVHFDANGQPAGIDYSALVAVLINHCNELEQRIAALEAG